MDREISATIVKVLEIEILIEEKVKCVCTEYQYYFVYSCKNFLFCKCDWTIHVQMMEIVSWQFFINLGLNMQMNKCYKLSWLMLLFLSDPGLIGVEKNCHPHYKYQMTSASFDNPLWHFIIHNLWNTDFTVNNLPH